MRFESRASVFARRSCGVISIIALPLAIATGFLGQERVATVSLLTFFALPWLAFIVHFNLASPLTDEEQALWRTELRAGNAKATIAAWTYLLTADLTGRARQFGPYRGSANDN